MSTSFGDSKRKPGSASSQVTENLRRAVIAQTWGFESKGTKVPSASFVPAVVSGASSTLTIETVSGSEAPPPPPPPPSYGIVPSGVRVAEGTSLTFTITTANVADGISLQWENIGSATLSPNSGTATIRSNTASIVLTAPSVSEDKTVMIQVTRAGNLVAMSREVTVYDISPTYSIGVSQTPFDEGPDYTFTITTTNVANGTTLYWTIDGNVSAEDFMDGVSGSVEIYNNSGQVFCTPLRDRLTEGNETLQFHIRTGSATGPIVVSSQSITLNDTSLDPTPPSSAESLMAFAIEMSSRFQDMNVSPTGSGPLTINGNFVGNFGYCVVTPPGNVSYVTSVTPSAWFTDVEDTESAVIIINGNLTLDGAILTPHKRKLFMLVYISGDLTFTNEGYISMTARGANHSGAGASAGYTAPVDIMVAKKVIGASDIIIPATGGAGGAQRNTTGANGGFSVDPLSGATGGGASGQCLTAGCVAGAGSAGTCFSSGAGGGGASVDGSSAATTAGDAGINGGAGGDGTGTVSLGGVGNPGGSGPYSSGLAGTAGTLVVICNGRLIGSGGGACESRGSGTPAIGGKAMGGNSGGGSVTLIYRSQLAGINANAGVIGTTAGRGGAGSARKIAISSI